MTIRNLSIHLRYLRGSRVRGLIKPFGNELQVEPENNAYVDDIEFITERMISELTYYINATFCEKYLNHCPEIAYIFKKS